MNYEEQCKLIAQRLEAAELFTNRFGSFAKSDYEVLMFSIFLDLQDQPVSDYDLSIKLGITESKVRSLRVKSQLLYPKNLSWSEELQKALQRGQFNKDDMTITIMIENPSVQNMLKHEIEEAYGMVHLSFNPKLMTLPVESYLILALKLEDNEDEALKRLNEKWLKENKNAERITKEDLLKKMLKKLKGEAGVEALLEIAQDVIPGGKTILGAVLKLMQ